MDAESEPLDIDEGRKIPMKDQVVHRTPLKTQLAIADERVFYNANVKKPVRKIKKLDIAFGKLTD